MEYVPLFNEFLRFFRLDKFFWIGKTLTFVKPPNSHQMVLPSQTNTRFDIVEIKDSSIIPELQKCLEGTKDYSYSQEELRVKFEEMFSNGSHVLVARDKEKANAVAGLLWITAKKYNIQNRILLDLPKNLVFQEFAFVKKEYRGLGVYSLIIQHVFRQFSSSFVACIIIPYNEVSIAIHSRYGYERNGSIYYFYLCGLMLATFRFGSTRRRLFRIRNKSLYPIKLNDPSI